MSFLYFTKNIDFRLYIGHAVAFVCLSAYALIFYFIWKDGAWSREMRRREKIYVQKKREAVNNMMEDQDSDSASLVQKNPVVQKRGGGRNPKGKNSKKKIVGVICMAFVAASNTEQQNM